MPPAEPTVEKALQWATAYLASKGIGQPRLDAEVLLAHTLGIERIELYLQRGRPLTVRACKDFWEKVDRRAKYEPVAYIVGKKEFWSLDLEVGPEVLIPRPETEFLVEEAKRIGDQIPESPLRILDIGTGSGNIAISLAKELPNSRLYALDISLQALRLAQRNVQRHQVSAQIRLIAGDLFTPLHKEGARFHLIVSNPPYVAREGWAELPPDIRLYEPRLALDGGERGETLLRRIIKEAEDHLYPGGYLLLEFSPSQLDSIRSWVKDQGRLWMTRIVKDYSGLPRVVIIKRE